jgi:5-formaminoimidazole-4-carboxamide-1-beta-D-ribofuranosyl 5'-monophosphate synthetase
MTNKELASEEKVKRIAKKVEAANKAISAAFALMHAATLEDPELIEEITEIEKTVLDKLQNAKQNAPELLPKTREELLNLDEKILMRLQLTSESSGESVANIIERGMNEIYYEMMEKIIKDDE